MNFTNWKAQPAWALMLIIFFIFIGSSSGQDTEIFHPNATTRVQKQVKTYLPFHQKAQQVSIEFVDDMAIMEGDIVLGPSILYSGEVQLAVAIDGDSYRWEDGVIPYTIESGHPKMRSIRNAIAHIRENTNLKMVPRTNQADYVTFVTGDGCSSRVGRVKGRQKITLGNCPFGTIVHEILHAAGLWHEQARSDRNDHITILWDNIESGKKHNFEKRVSDGIDIGAYDCGSIMHYSAFAFSKNGMPTIESKECETLGQRSGMSPADIAAINKLYKVKVPEDLLRRPWFVLARHSGKAIDIQGGRKTPRANVQQFKLNRSEAQKFRFVTAGGGYYYIQNVGSNLVLDIEGGNNSPGANVWQFTRNGSDGQKWRLIDAGNDNYYIRSKLGKLNLEVHTASTDNGVNIRVAATKGGPGQLFTLREAPNSAPPKESYGKPLEQYWNSTRKDNFTTASTVGKNNAVNGKYRFVRVDGYVLTKPNSVEGTPTPLYLYYHDERRDNFTTASTLGIQAAERGGYRKVGIEGYVLSSVRVKYKNLYKPLWLYYHDQRKDNFITATTQGMREAEAGGYRKVRIEGYVRKNNYSNLAPTNTSGVKN